MARTAAYTSRRPREINDPDWQEYARTRSTAARNKLIERYMHLVYSQANHLGARVPAEVGVDELVSSGSLGLIYAVEHYRLESGNRFGAYAIGRIRGAILDGLRQVDWVHRQVRNRIRRLETAVNRFVQLYERQPSRHELQKFMRLPSDAFDLIYRDGNRRRPVSLFSPMASDSPEYFENRDPANLMVHLPNVHGEPPRRHCERQDLQRYLTQGLNTIQRLIILLYYYEGLTMRQIGRSLGVSESHVSKLHSQTIEHLKATQKGKEL